MEGNIINMVDILEVARYTLTLGAMKHRKLQILCYYMQVWHMVFCGEKFMNTDFQAWKHGPTSERLYERYKEWEALKIPRTTYTLYNLKLNDKEKEFIQKVFLLYKDYSTKEMQILSKSEEPYIKTRGSLPSDAPCKVVIDNNLIKDFYTKMVEQEKLKQG